MIAQTRTEKTMDVDDLLKRLSDGGETCGADRCRVRNAESGCLCATAADFIKKQREYIEVYQDQTNILMDRIEKLEKKLASVEDRND